MIKFGPAGLGGIKEAEENLKQYSQLGLKACEIAFTYGVYIKKKEDAERIGKTAEKLNIELSIHAPYWINLNSSEKDKVEKSKERILKCLEIGTWLGAKKVIFHPGYYRKIKGTKFPLINSSFKSGVTPDYKKETFENIKKEILEIMEKAKQKNYTPKLAPETTGKTSVFGSIDEILKLAKETGCSFCIDFAHILARYKTYNFREVKEKFAEYKNWHIHFSGIEYAEKGEKYHKKTPEEELKKLLSNLPKDKDIVIINESPFPVEDSVLGINLPK